MAAIWPVYEGREPTRGEPWAEMPIADVAKLFDLRATDFISPLEITPRFGRQDRDRWFQGYRHVVVEVDDDEARASEWKAGFYRVQTKPDEAFKLILLRALTREFGERSVTRIGLASTTDAAGGDALRVTIVLAPEAVELLLKRGVLEAIGRAQRQVWAIRKDLTPIVDFATEAELAEYANH